jgi:putative membrane protein
MIGFCLPLSKALAQAASIPDLVIWAGLALIVQLAAYGIANLMVPGLSEKIEQNMLSAAIAAAGLSLTCGMLSAAAMTE